jgi:hypothetical protein
LTVASSSSDRRQSQILQEKNAFIRRNSILPVSVGRSMWYRIGCCMVWYHGKHTIKIVHITSSSPLKGHLMSDDVMWGDVMLYDDTLSWYLLACFSRDVPTMRWATQFSTGSSLYRS